MHRRNEGTLVNAAGGIAESEFICHLCTEGQGLRLKARRVCVGGWRIIELAFSLHLVQASDVFTLSLGPS